MTTITQEHIEHAAETAAHAITAAEETALRIAAEGDPDNKLAEFEALCRLTQRGFQDFADNAG